MSELLIWYGKLMELSKINPILSGIIGAWLATVVTLLCRNIPDRIWRFIKTQSIRSIEMNNVERTGINDDYIAFLDWFNTAKMWKWTRNWQRTEVRSEGTYRRITVPGYSRHYFLWKGRLFWFNKHRQDSDGIDFQKETLSIGALFISEKKLFEFVDSFKFVPKPNTEKTTSQAYRWHATDTGKGYWYEVATLPPRALKTIAQPKGFGESIVDSIKQFEKDYPRYLEQGIPHKLSFEISGPPGTGKTSLIRAIADAMHRDIYIISWSLFTDESFAYALTQVPSGNFVAIEDYESNRNLWPIEIREKVFTGNDNSSRGLTREAGSYAPTLSGVLNAIDGIIPLNGLILFWTTNHPEYIHEAVRRDGRMDHRLVLDILSHDDIVRFINDIFPEYFYVGNGTPFESIGGAQLSKLLIDSKYDAETFVQLLPRKQESIAA